MDKQKIPHQDPTNLNGRRRITIPILAFRKEVFAFVEKLRTSPRSSFPGTEKKKAEGLIKSVTQL
jgi:hypothetical protein